MVSSLSRFQWSLCKLIVLIGLTLYMLLVLAQLLVTRSDLDWMPPEPDMSHVTDSPRKKHPDGPLVLRDGILMKEEEGNNDDNGKKNGNAKAIANANNIQILDNKQRRKVDKAGGKVKGKRLPISERFLVKLQHTAKQLHRRMQQQQQHSGAEANGFVLFAVINQAYAEMSLNWLCNIYALPAVPPMPENGSNLTAKAVGSNITNNGTKQQQKPTEEGKKNSDLHQAVLLVTLDSSETCKQLRNSWPKITCLALWEEQPLSNKKVAIDTEELKALSEPLSWGRLRYVQILTARANMMAALAEAKLPFVLVEMDAVWLRNPMGLFQRANQLEDADLVMPLNSATGSAGKGQRLAFDPMVAYATNGSRRLLQEMRRVLNTELDMMDQDLLNQLCSGQYAGAVCREFVADEIADGAWLKLSDGERTREAQRAGHWPFVVNNNYYVGVHNKMARQAINGFWFLSTKQKQCNLSKAKRILAKYQSVPAP